MEESYTKFIMQDYKMVYYTVGEIYVKLYYARRISGSPMKNHMQSYIMRGE